MYRENFSEKANIQDFKTSLQRLLPLLIGTHRFYELLAYRVAEANIQ
jgi:hypothetical protein